MPRRGAAQVQDAVGYTDTVGPKGDVGIKVTGLAGFYFIDGLFGEVEGVVQGSGAGTHAIDSDECARWIGDDSRWGRCATGGDQGNPECAHRNRYPSGHRFSVIEMGHPAAASFRII